MPDRFVGQGSDLIVNGKPLHRGSVEDEVIHILQEHGMPPKPTPDEVRAATLRAQRAGDLGREMVDILLGEHSKRADEEIADSKRQHIARQMAIRQKKYGDRFDDFAAYFFGTIDELRAEGKVDVDLAFEVADEAMKG